jgi:hypothetical protein
MTDGRRRDGAETPIRRVSRPTRPDAQIIAVLAVAILVVGAGIGLGSPSSRPEGSGLSGSSSSSGASGLGSPSPAPSPRSARACDPIQTGASPAVRLASTSGDRSPVLGVAAPEPAGGPTQPVGSVGTAMSWIVPGLERGVLLPEGTALVLMAERSACLAYVSVAYAPATAIEPSTDARARTVRVSGLEDRVNIGGLPIGDWVVRVVVTVQAGLDGSYASDPRVAYFRVVSGSVTELAPSPQVTPAVACGAGAGAGALPALVLVVDDGPALPMPVRPAEADPIPIRLGQTVEIRTEGDACAQGWTVEVRDDVGNSFLQESYPNPVDNPFIAAQNRWTLTQLLVGDAVVAAKIRFGGNREAEGTWRLRVETAELPSVTAVGSDGGSAVVLPGCGQFWALPSGISAFQPCDFQSIPDGLQTLAIGAGDAVRIVVPGWTIVDWFGRCGESRPVGAGTLMFVVTNECDLGGNRAPGPIGFAPWPGDHVVLVGITLERSGVRAYGNFLVRVVADG